jgi:hypothetical protein
MKEAIRELQQSAREQFNKEIEKLPKYDMSKDGISGDYYYKAEDIKRLNELDNIIEKSLEIGYFMGREDLKQEIIADFDKK